MGINGDGICPFFVQEWVFKLLSFFRGGHNDHAISGLDDIICGILDLPFYI
jgi:hypothetical protein